MKRTFAPLIMPLLFAVIQVNAQVPSKTISALADGTWHKVSVTRAGIHIIDKQLIEQFGLSSRDGASIGVFGNRGGVLPQLVGGQKTDDIEEMAVIRQGLDDGSFDSGDYILFYAEGPALTVLDDATGLLSVHSNIYDDFNHYFIGRSANGKEMEKRSPASTAADITFTAFDELVRIEEDRVNLLGKYRPPGSGKRWFGDEFSGIREKAYNLEIPDLVSGSEVHFQMEFAGRAGSSSAIYATANGNRFSRLIRGVDMGDVEDPWAEIVEVSGSYTTDESIQSVIISYPPKGNSSSGWLDYLQVQGKRSLIYRGGTLSFRVAASREYLVSGYLVQNTSGDDVTILDVTDPFNTIVQEVDRNQDGVAFAAPSEGVVREFVAFGETSELPRPEYSGEVPNQNLHGISRADLAIVYHRDFELAAMDLADHRRVHNGYTVVTAEVEQVMNEFAGGSSDPTAIRDFAAMLKSRDENFRFLLLLGDGSYDYKHRDESHDDDNFVPVFETDESMNPIRSFPSDDYYALLNPTEGESLSGAIDIAVGRIPVGSELEANAVINKIIHYDMSPTSLGDWRQKLAYVADDEDSNLHLNQSEDITGIVESRYDEFNVNRIYLDAYEQVSTPGGPRYPDVNDAINTSIFKGVLAINYLGHGGYQGWSQERVLGLKDIQSWTNIDNLPLFVTATCSFTGYDEPSYVSAGEQVLLNPEGGAIALLTTVRAVYSSSNKRLTQEVFEHLFEKDGDEYLPIGEIMRRSKNSNARDTVDINARKFAIIGDPSMYLAYPENGVRITSINGQQVDQLTDTLGALDRVTLEGEIVSPTGSPLPGFQGIASVSVYDKPVKITTLANDPRSYERRFENLSRLIFRGTASVEEGKFEISFVIPKDIEFSYGNGKISVYASDGFSADAAGSYSNLVIGGSSKSLGSDTDGPEIGLYLNRESFRSGDIVGPDNTLVVALSDGSGINVIGNSIGHDLVASLEGPLSGTYVLNEFYEANTDDFTSGQVQFPLLSLPDGDYRLTVTAWDGANNFAERTIEFTVDTDGVAAFEQLLNYPNPFSDHTTFRITHNLGASSFDIEIDVFDLAGRHVANIEYDSVPSEGGVIDGIQWSGINSSGVALANGIYVYQATLRSDAGLSGQEVYRSPFGKLVLMN